VLHVPFDHVLQTFTMNSSFSISQEHHVDGPLRKAWINKKRKFKQESGESIEEHHYDHGKQ